LQGGVTSLSSPANVGHDIRTPLFGVAAGHLVLGDPVTPAFAAAVALVATGLVLVNRA
jgi:drug/metabolite transporter (DMT)-like permease